MAKKESLVVRMFLNSIVEAGKIMASGFLIELKNQVTEGKINEVDYIDAIQSGGKFFAILDRLAQNSSKTTDDKIVALFYDPIKERAEADGIEF
jgi:hypothetical protein